MPPPQSDNGNAQGSGKLSNGHHLERDTEQPMGFLRRWYEGSFDVCAREWPEAPESLKRAPIQAVSPADAVWRALFEFVQALDECEALSFMSLWREGQFLKCR